MPQENKECRFCHARIPGHAKVCSACGRDLETGDPYKFGTGISDVVESEKESPSTTAPENKQSSPASPIWKRLALLVLVFLAGFGMRDLFRIIQQKQQPPPIPQPAVEEPDEPDESEKKPVQEGSELLRAVAEMSERLERVEVTVAEIMKRAASEQAQADVNEPGIDLEEQPEAAIPESPVSEREEQEVPVSAEPQTSPLPAERKPVSQMTIDIGRGVTMEFVWIPPGEFVMGSAASEAGRFDDEGPQHRVRISKGFWMGKYEVTQEQWEAAMGNNPSHFKNAGRNAPVEMVSWEDCQQFLRRLNVRSPVVGSKAGQRGRDVTFSLPTEAEWEYACRAGTTTKYYTGNADADLGRAGWHSGSSGNSGNVTHPVGQKEPNSFGLFDMHGNVWEWCRDLYQKNYYARSPLSDPRGPSSGGLHVVRGGAWGNDARHCRSANRRGDNRPGINDFGLRVVARP